MSRRAAFPESELRRWARIARAEGVAIRGTRDADGNVTVVIDPAANGAGNDNSFDRLIGGAA